MQLGTTEFERALKAVSEGSQSLDSLLTVLSREDQVGTGERAARLGMVQALRNSGRLSEAASDQVVKTIYRSADPNVSAPAPSAPVSGSHPSNSSTWAEINRPRPRSRLGACCAIASYSRRSSVQMYGVVFRALDRRREEAQDRRPHVAIKVLETSSSVIRTHCARCDANRARRNDWRIEHRQRLRLRPGRAQRLHGHGAARRRAARHTVRRRGLLGLEKAEALRMLSEMGAALARAHGSGSCTRISSRQTRS